MKVVIAPDKFKGSLSAVEACQAIEKGIKRVDPSIEVVKVPLADGGEGTLDVIESFLSPIRIEVEVIDPLSRPIKAHYLKSKNTAYIEMAQASGLQLLDQADRDPRYTTTYGTGQLIKDALDRGVSEVYLMIGGSATNDAGIGMAQALGYSLKDKSGAELMPVGDSLAKIEKIESPLGDVPWVSCQFVVLTDVQNPLFGKNGAAYVYGTQKGASQDVIRGLDEGLRALANQINNGLHSKNGAGAAGGLGYGAMSFLNAELRSGIDVIMELTSFKDTIHGADLIISGEGKFDSQTLAGKVISGVSRLGNQHNIPIGILCGIIEDQKSENLGFEFMNEISALASGPEDSMRNAYDYLTTLAENQIAEFIKS